MTYSIRLKDHDMTDAFRRMARGRLELAIEASAATSPDARMKAVHSMRRRIKELRGLLRMVRPDFDGFRPADQALRDTARGLSELRDVKVRYDTLTHLSDYVELPPDTLATYFDRLATARDHAYSDDHAAPILARARSELEALRQDTKTWQLRHSGRKAVFPGVAKTYGAAQEAMARAMETRSPEDFHIWRKDVKYHFYHSQILTPIWPEAMDVHCRAASDLGELLGRHHDLVVLGEEARAADLPSDIIEALEKSLHKRIKRLEREAFLAGARMFADSPETLTRRWSVWWRLWRSDQS